LAALTRVAMTTSVLEGLLLGTAPASANETPREMGEEVAVTFSPKNSHP
jgi:hypothetical protein